MHISYKKLWKLLIDHDMKKTELREKAQISAGTLAKLGKDEYVSLDVLVRICAVLHCQPGDIMEVTDKLPQVAEGVDRYGAK